MNPENTLVFKLHVKCKRRKKMLEEAKENEKYENANVYSGDIEWVPQVGQKEYMGPFSTNTKNAKEHSKNVLKFDFFFVFCL